MAFAVKASRAFLATGDEVVDAVIVVDDTGHIERVRRSSDGDLPEGLEVLEFEDATVLPGLTDMHAHPTKRGVTEYKLSGATTRVVTALALRGVWNLRLCIENGITTIRDVAATTPGIFDLREATETGQVVGPRIFAAGQAISMTGGHGWSQSATIEADGPEAVRTAARLQIREGADLLKVIATGGIEARERYDEVQLSLEEISVAVEEARRKRIHVAAHASHSNGVRLAVEAGVRTIEHGVIMDEETVAQIAARGTYYDPTLEVYAVLARGEPGRSQHSAEVAAAHLDDHRRSFEMAMRAGVKIVAGSDAGGLRWPLGESLHDELARMVSYGMSPKDALIAATATAADCLDQSHAIGTLQKGRWADMVVVAGNPAADIRALRDIKAVFKGGSRLV